MEGWGLPWLERYRQDLESTRGFRGGSDGKESTCNEGHVRLIPGLERPPGEGHGNPLQYSCLENYMDRGAWQAIVHGIAESDTTEHTDTRCLDV